MQITNQKKMAAQLLKCGVNRVWINPSYLDQVAQSVQKEDIREAMTMDGSRQKRFKELLEFAL